METIQYLQPKHSLNWSTANIMIPCTQNPSVKASTRFYNEDTNT